MFERIRWLIVGTVALLLAACGSGGDTPQPDAQAPVTQTVGSAGGTINGPSGIVLTIPPGALAADTPITIAVDAAGAPPLPSGTASVGSTYSVTPHGTTFGVPVTISVPFDPSQLPAGQEPALIKTLGDSWRQLVAERNGNTLTAAMTELSVIGVFCCLVGRLEVVDQPDDQTAFEGGFAFFRAEVIGTGIASDARPRYQWFRNGFVMPGETNPEILIPRVTPAHDNSLYMLRATAGTLSVDSRAARLLVQPLAPVIVNQPLDAQEVEGDASCSARRRPRRCRRRCSGR